MKEKIRLLQQWAGVPEDGIIGPVTLDALLAKARLVVAEDHWEDLAAPLIQQFEGYAKDLGDGRVQAYPDPASGGDPWTIGFGSTGPDIRKGTIWTRAQADQRFREHLGEFGRGVRVALDGAQTTAAQMAAMVSLAYNVGLTAFRNSTLLKKHRSGDYAGACAEFSRWNRAGGRVMAGLTRRRAAEAELYGSG